MALPEHEIAQTPDTRCTDEEVARGIVGGEGMRGQGLCCYALGIRIDVRCGGFVSEEVRDGGARRGRQVISTLSALNRAICLITGVRGGCVGGGNGLLLCHTA